MTDYIIRLTRIGVVVLWIAMILSLLSIIPAPYGAPIVWIGSFVLIVHLSEYVFARKKLEEQRDMEVSFVKTMVFGLAHLVPLVDEYARRWGNR